ncbi:hypothetical protein AMK59_8493 [Oryctes borbonicus]|uniref:HPS5-like beta-propeller domain-containing protein n=1 Tax=Oryctes borbonicus TaxID=1629725 RepID=A0A0T6AWS7_9SCAR|nr:hypothetical protein AMK59_8493 [Oryctes borbonicus]
MAISASTTRILREWAPLTDLFNKLPTKIQNGIFTQEIQLTCVDVLSEFIALGTNVGVVYWYNRKKKDLQRLRCENTNSAITVIKIISTVDYMLACGNSAGNVNIFQVPKSHPENLPEKLKPKNKQVERYTVADMHKGPVSALEWSKNGMKLFSGDRNGLVILTELDFYMHICKSVEVLNESYEVVQLSYYQQNLLISTTYRSIVCQREGKWKVSQVGKKDRKVLGKFGGTFYNNGIRPKDVILYCTRPGLRIWQSDVQGNVQQTLLFKEILCKDYPEVSLINPISHHLKRLKPVKDASFGTLLLFQDELLVTHGAGVVYILNPKELTILHTVSNLRGILCVACNKDEIFILEEDRSLIRLAYHPETSNQESYSTTTVNTNTFSPISTSFKEFTSKIQNSNIVPAIPPLAESPENIFNIHTDLTSVVNAEEATESPQCRNNHVNLSENALLNAMMKNNKTEIYNKIAQEDFNDTIIFKHHKHRKPIEMGTSANSLSSTSSDEHESTITNKATMMNLSTVSILPDLRSPDSILNDIEQKEKLLADVLSFDKIKINMESLKEGAHPTSTSNKEEDTEIKNAEITKNVCKNISIPVPILHTQTSDNLRELNNCKDASPKDTVKQTNGISVKPCDTLLLDTPDMKVIPHEWNLSSVQLVEQRHTSESDNSLGDWELI